MLLAKKSRQGARTVSLLVVTPRGKTGSVARNLGQLGGKIAYRHNRLGYVRVRVPAPQGRPGLASEGHPGHQRRRGPPAARPAAGRRDRPDSAASARRRHSAEQPVHADPRHGRCAVRQPASELGRPRRHRRHRRLGRRPRPCEPEHDEHGAEEDRRLGHRHTPVSGRRPVVARLHRATVDDRRVARSPRSAGRTPDSRSTVTYRLARMREDLLGATSEYGIACSGGGTGSDLDRNGRCGDFFVMRLAPVRQHGLGRLRRRCELRRRVHRRMKTYKRQPRHPLLRP